MRGQRSDDNHTAPVSHRGGEEAGNDMTAVNALPPAAASFDVEGLPPVDTLSALHIENIISALKWECTVYRHLVQAQTRGLNHISAIERSHDKTIAAVVCAEILASNKVLDKPRKEQAKRIENLIKELPVAAWVKSIKGAGLLNLGLIIGEAGAGLDHFTNPSKLWKRFGLHVMPDGRAARRFKNKELAELCGYCPRRRAVMFILGECLIRKQNVYKVIYDERKAYEIARDPGIGKMQAHLRAHRYMTKRFLRDLWKQWRATRAMTTNEARPAISKE